MHDDDVRRGGEQRHCGKILDEVVVELAVQRHIDGVRDVAHQQRVTVGRRLRRELGTDVGAGARPVVEDNLLGKALGQLAAEDARQRVGTPARRERQDEADRFVRILRVHRRDAGNQGGRNQDGKQGGKYLGTAYTGSNGNHCGLPPEMTVTTESGFGKFRLPRSPGTVMARRGRFKHTAPARHT